MRKICLGILQNQSAKKPLLTVNIQLGHMRGCSLLKNSLSSDSSIKILKVHLLLRWC